MENHATRPEVVGAREAGLGMPRRFSATLGIDMLYVAAPVRHPHDRVRARRAAADRRPPAAAAILTATLTALGLALVGGRGIAWRARRPHRPARPRHRGRRRSATGAATSRRRGSTTATTSSASVARALDDSVQELGAPAGRAGARSRRMAAILAGMIEGVIVVDPQGRLQLVNDAARGDAEARRRCRSAATTSRPSGIRRSRIWSTAALARRRAGVGRALAAARCVADHHRARRADGTGGAAHGVVLVLHDITDLRRADQIRRDFVANVSHELRTPLTAIRGYVEALSEGDTSPEETQRFLDIIMRHTLRMERLVKDLLRLARLDAGQEDARDRAVRRPRGCVHVGGRRPAPALDARAAAAWRSTIAADAATVPRRSRQAARRAAQSGREREHLRDRSRRRSGLAAATRRTIASRSPCSDEGPGIPEEDLCARVRALLSRRQVARARPGRHRPRPRDRQAPGRAARRQGDASANRPDGGARFTIELLPAG